VPEYNVKGKVETNSDSGEFNTGDGWWAPVINSSPERRSLYNLSIGGPATVHAQEGELLRSGREESYRPRKLSNQFRLHYT
jgi:hypothetical protein